MTCNRDLKRLQVIGFPYFTVILYLTYLQNAYRSEQQACRNDDEQEQCGIDASL